MESEKKTARDYKFYKFINIYRERYKTHNDEILTHGINDFFAILDGQQRLTSLYIGLKGSYAYKMYRKKWENNEGCIPTRHLYLNITKKLEGEEDGREYDFYFLNKSETKEKEIYVDENNNEWFKVGRILNYKDNREFDKFLQRFNKGAKSREILKRLREVILNEKIINFFLEEEQDLNKALNIFIRMNSGAEHLSFSDLIMSIAVANWEEQNARQEIHSLVDAIKDKGFYISKDLILRTYLFLYSKDIKFKVTNFSRENARNFEDNWNKIRDCIIETFDLLRVLGFDDHTLTSKNAVLPIIYYLYHKDIYPQFSTKIKYRKDRDIIKKWLNVVLIKQVFGRSSDTVLSQIRQTFTDDVKNSPIKGVCNTYPTEFKKVKNMNVDDDFIEEILYTQKDDKYAFSILSLLYPNLDYKNNNFHKDHIHPKSDFSNLSKKDKDNYGYASYNSIYNLQLLDANENESKNSKLLKEWVEKNTDKNNRRNFLKKHIIPDVDLSIKNFGEFFEERKKLLIKKLRVLLN